ncbi:hypothetical protein OG301_33940 [Streptomyces platensis]|uniref:hypothetical protein n=1 Tax=Streptomyces platensis TaxID=58346 RepID=UPI002ED0A545|nr:hypothetical protein OG301_33940 [Streptomyces platensis]
MLLESQRLPCSGGRHSALTGALWRHQKRAGVGPGGAASAKDVPHSDAPAPKKIQP